NGMTGENAYEIKLSVYGSTQLRTILSLGEITFNDQSSPRSYSFHAPEAATYAIFSRNSENVLAASNLNIIQQSPDYTSQNLAQQWVFEPVEGAYTITNKANGKVITDNGTYFLDLSNRSSDLDGQIFSVAETDGGYVKIVSLKTGKAIDVEGASTASGANIGVWDFGTSGNDHRQWALVKLKDTPTSSPSLLQKDEMAWLSSGAGKLSVHNLPSTCHLNIYNLNGVSLEKMKTQNSSCSFSLPSGLYIVHVDSNTQSYSLKGFVF
ncbi:MAG TPA: RICIN domain-containing protein, partial [Sunxiuqinia sp.]|nr:RICIN domain-containing protein [Sunxiuqinia sp.]